MASLGSVELELRLNKEQFDRDLRDLSNLSLKNLTLTVKVDDRELYKLNKHLDLKQRHFQQVQQYINRNPLAIRVDGSQLTRTIDSVRRLRAELGQVSATSVSASAKGGGANKELLNAIQALPKQIAEEIKKQSTPGVGARVGGAIAAPFKTAGALGGSIFQGLVYGATAPISADFGKGISLAIEKASGEAIGSTKLLGQRMAEALASSLGDVLPEDLSKELTSGIAEALGKQDVLVASRSARTKQRKGQAGERSLAVEQLNVERREALRDLYSAQDRSAQLVRDVEQARTDYQKALKGQERISQERLTFASSEQVPDLFREQFPELDAQNLRERYSEYLDEVYQDFSDRIDSLIAFEEKAALDFRKLQEEITKKSNVSKGVKETQATLRPADIPTAYADILRDITGKDVAADLIPQLRINEAGLAKAGAEARYNIESNVVEVTRELYEALQAGQLTIKQLETIYEEIEHARQFGFGSVKGVEARRQFRPLTPSVTPTVEELKAIGPELDLYAPENRGYELQAKVVASRKAKEAKTRQERTEALNELTRQFGIGGERLEKAAAANLNKALGDLRTLGQLSEKAGVDLGEGLQELTESIYTLSNNVRSSIDLLLGIQIKPVDAQMVQQVAGAIGKQFEELEQLLQTVDAFKKDAITTIKRETTATPVKAEVVKDREGGALGAVLGNTTPVIENAAGLVFKGATLGADLLGKTLVFSTNSIIVPGAQALGDALLKSATTILPASYQFARGLESVALDFIPAGRALKGITKNAILPAAAFTAATNLLPGGAVAGEALGSLVGGTVGPATEALTGLLSSSAASAIGAAVPTGVIGGKAIAGVLTSTSTSAITAAGHALGGVLTEAVTLILGGSLVSSAANTALKSVPGVKQVIAALPPASTPPPELKLPFSPPQLVKTEVTPYLPPAGARAALPGTAPKAKVAEVVTDVPEGLRHINQVESELTKLRSGVSKGSRETAIKAAKEIESAFRSTRKTIDGLLQEGNIEQAKAYAEVFVSNAKRAQSELTSILKQAKTEGIDINFGDEISSTVGRAKGLISNMLKPVNRALASSDTSSIGSDVASGISGSIKQNLGEVKQAGGLLGKELIAGTEDELEIRSPSKVFQRIGQDVLRGLGIGLEGTQQIFNSLKSQFSQGVKNVQAEIPLGEKLPSLAIAETPLQPSTDALIKIPASKTDINALTDKLASIQQQAVKEANVLSDRLADLKQQAQNDQNALSSRLNNLKQESPALELTDKLAALQQQAVKEANVLSDRLADLNLQAQIKADTITNKLIEASLQSSNTTEALVNNLASLKQSGEKERSSIQSKDQKISAFDQQGFTDKLASIQQQAVKEANVLSDRLADLKQQAQNDQNALSSRLNNLKQESPALELTDKLAALQQQAVKEANVLSDRLADLKQQAESDSINRSLSNAKQQGIVTRVAASPLVLPFKPEPSGPPKLDFGQRDEPLESGILRSAAYKSLTPKQGTSKPRRLEDISLPDRTAPLDISSRLNRRGATGEQKDLLDKILKLLHHAEAASDKFDAALRRASKSADNRMRSAARGIDQELKRIESGIPSVNKLEQAFGRFGNTAKDVLTSVLALVGVFSFGDAIVALGQSSLRASIELDKLNTSLSFASGGAAAGAKNLAFVRAEVDRLKVPLAESQQGFAQLNAATRGTSLAGQATKDIFTGIAEASTVLSLSADQSSGALLALTQIASKGTVQAEELRGQLGERIPGAFQIAARAMGVTEAQLNKMLETGQVLAQDFLPRFARQLKAEFGDAAVLASKNAQSAIFNLQNQTLKLQESFGRTIQPAFVLSLNAASEGMKFLVDNSQSVLVALTTLGGFIAVPLLKSLFQFAKALPLVQAGLAGVKGGLIALRTSALPMLLTFAGITAALEVFKAGQQLINGGPLTRQLDEMSSSARKAAEAFQSMRDEVSKPITTQLPPANIFDSFINLTNRITEEHIRSAPYSEEERARKLQEFKERKPYTYAEKDRDDAITTIRKNAQLLSKAADAAFQEVAQGRAGKTNLSLLPQIEVDIQEIANRRKTLEGQIQREFSDKGLAVPTTFKTQKEELDAAYNDAIAKQQQFSKEGVDQFNRLNRSVEITKATLKSLSDPATIASYGGEEFVAPIRKELEQVIAKAEPARDALADLLATTKADPILAMTDAFRKLNLELAKTAEQSQLAFATQRETIAKNQLGGFSGDIFASRRASLAAAQAERDRLAKDLQALERDFAGKQAAIAQPSFKPVLDRFGLTPQSTAADIQGLLDLPSTKDEDKSILETLKTAKEAQLKLHEARTQFYEAEGRVRSEAQAQAIDSIQHVAARTQAIIQQSEDARTIAVKKAISERTLTEEQAAVDLARIQADATTKQKQSVDIQLQNLRDYHSQGLISAELFDSKERELVLQQSSLKRQLAEQELAVREEINKQILNGIEQANQKVEAAIQKNQTLRNTQAKQQQLQLLRTPGDQRVGEFAVQRENIDAEKIATNERIGLIQTELEQTRIAEQNKYISAKEATQKRLQLQQQLADANGRLVDLEIDQEKLHRDEVIHRIDVQIQAQKNQSDLAISGIEQQKAAQDLLNASVERTSQLEQSRFDLRKALSDAAIASEQAELDTVNRALELRKKLDDQDLDPEVRREIGNSLRDAGFSSGASELEIVRRRQAIEEDIANKRLAALQAEQEYQRESLKLDLQRQAIAAQTAEFEAEIGVLRATQAQIEASAALSKARATNDTVAIKAAEVGLEIANRQLELSNKQLANSKENLKIQGELADNALRAQSATQQAALDQANAAESARQQAEGLERAEAAASRRVENAITPSAGLEDLSDSKSKRKPTLLEAARNQLPEIKTTTYLPPDQSRHQGLNPRTSVEAFFKRRLGLDPLESAESQYKRSLGLNPRESVENYFNRQLGLIESSTVSQLSAAAKPVEVPAQTTGYAQFVGGLKEANRDIVTCLRELIDANKTAIASPRTLNVSSPSPVSDGARIWSDIARQSVVASGLG